MPYTPQPPSANQEMDLARLAFSYVMDVLYERNHPATDDPVANQTLLDAIHTFIAKRSL